MKQKVSAARRRFLEEQRLDRIWEARGDDQSNIPKKVRSTEACTSSLERPVEGGSGSAQGKVEESGGRPQLDQTRPGRESRSKQVNLEGFHWRLGTVWRLAQPGLTPHGVSDCSRPEGFQAASAVQLVAREVPRTTLASRRQRQGPVWSWGGGRTPWHPGRDLMGKGVEVGSRLWSLWWKEESIKAERRGREEDEEKEERNRRR